VRHHVTVLLCRLVEERQGSGGMEEKAFDRARITKQVCMIADTIRWYKTRHLNPVLGEYWITLDLCSPDLFSKHFILRSFCQLLPLFEHSRE
jgi:hypothetical protein